MKKNKNFYHERHERKDTNVTNGRMDLFQVLTDHPDYFKRHEFVVWLSYLFVMVRVVRG